MADTVHLEEVETLAKDACARVNHRYIALFMDAPSPATTGDNGAPGNYGLNRLFNQKDAIRGKKVIF